MRGIGNNNWGPPMSYAANLGRDRIIRLLYDLGARDLQYAHGIAPCCRARSRPRRCCMRCSATPRRLRVHSAAPRIP